MRIEFVRRIEFEDLNAFIDGYMETLKKDVTKNVLTKDEAYHSLRGFLFALECIGAIDTQATTVKLKCDWARFVKALPNG